MPIKIAIFAASKRVFFALKKWMRFQGRRLAVAQNQTLRGQKEAIKNQKQMLKIKNSISSVCGNFLNQYELSTITLHRRTKIQQVTSYITNFPVISQTFIEALRCAEAVLLESALISPVVSSYIRDVLNGIHSTLLSSIQPFSKGSLTYQQYSGHSNQLDRAEAAFGMVIEDYAANLQLLDSYVIKILDRLGKTNSD